MLVFHDDRLRTGELSSDERSAIFDRFVQWADSLNADGVYRGSDALKSNVEARTVRKRGETITVDGPFTETTEAINGYIIVETDSIEAAIKLAESCPNLDAGAACEVREIAKIPKPAGWETD